MPDDSGFYDKYRVRRTDRSDEPGGKHEDCKYFVLDLTHDPYAVDALEAYGKACSIELPNLSKELLSWAANKRLDKSKEIIRCKRCGEFIRVEELVNGFCQNCREYGV